MSQHDMNISNQTFTATRSDINAALQALATNNSGATQPATTFAYQWWADTTSGILKQRNAANSAWVNVLNLATGVPTGAAASGENGDIISLEALASIPAVIKQYAQQIKGIGASVAANALTVSASALSLDFRSTTLSNGATTTVAGVPANLVVPTAATLGTMSGQQSDLLVLALNNAGVIELAIVNSAGGLDLSESGLISTNAISASATAANVVYSATARTNVAYQVIGLIRSTQAAAGTWATGPSLVQGAGGNALRSLQSLGHGQTWQNVLGGRVQGTTYYNTTGRPISIAFSGYSSAAIGAVTVGGVSLFSGLGRNTYFNNLPITFVVPPGASYSISGHDNVTTWAELR